MNKLGIHARLLIAVFMLIIALTLALGWMAVSGSRRFLLTRFEERIAFLSRNLAINAEFGIMIDDRTMLNRLAKSLLSEKDVAAAAIYDDAGRLLAEAANEAPGELNVIQAPVIQVESEEESLPFQWPSPGQPERKIIGKVMITYTTAGINRLLDAMKIRFVWIGVELAALFLLIFFIISRSLVAPVTQLAQAARRVARGDHAMRALPGALPETRELAEAFNAMLDSLEWSGKALEDAYQEMLQQKTLAEMGKFSMMIAHEVKNPLSIIKSSLDILKKDLPPGDTLVAYMEDEIQRLNRLIEDFLSFAHPVRPMFRPVDLNALMREVIERFELHKAGAPVEIRSQIPPEGCMGNVDRDLLVRALDNILKNAFEANEDDGVVEITVQGQSNLWTVRIEDEGEGVSPDDMKKIFEPFFSKRAKGTGLGLAYAAQVFTALGGRVRAENREGRGAAFIVEIPIR
ncbi:MAG: HAMP domain-containing protein [Desulfobacterales bacterium]|nr:HAMP domain-containing protein [Desulfobacterales bacterium]